MADVVVVGGGLGGLSAAIELADQGHKVRVFEAAGVLGGKAGVASVDGVSFDTGPSVLTMPDVLERLLGRAGMQLGSELVLRQPEPAFRYRWPDGPVLDLHHDLHASLESVRHSLGGTAGDELESFLAYSKQIWDAAAPRFVYGPAPTFSRIASMGLGAVMDLRKVDALRSMDRGIGRWVSNPYLLDVLRRYATYNGSDPRKAPATLNCIAHVEMAMGGFGVLGGIHRIPEVLADAARRLGVEFQLNAPVTEVLVASGSVTGVRVGTTEVAADCVVINADVAHLTQALLPETVSHGLGGVGTPSMSGWNAVYKARVRGAGFDRPPHEVLFPVDYSAEFEDIFDHQRPPRDPTVYLCAQGRCHGRKSWPDAEVLFVMANAPPEPQHGPSEPASWAELGAVVRARLVEADLLDASDPEVWTRTPSDLALAHPGSRGAIYGLASNDRMAAFRRPANRVAAIGGLFLASGSAHPGGGMPMAMLSGVAAAESVGRAHTKAEG